MGPTTAQTRRYRARIGPRHGAPRGGRIRWDKVGRVALVLVLFAVLISYVSPLTNLFDTWRGAGAAEERLAELTAENERLQRRAEELQTPAAALREARLQGLVGPGEQAYVIEDLE